MLVQMCVKPEEEEIDSTSPYKENPTDKPLLPNSHHNKDIPQQSECHSQGNLHSLQMWKNSRSTPEPAAFLNMLHTAMTQEIDLLTKCPKRRWKRISRQHDLLYVQTFT